MTELFDEVWGLNLWDFAVAKKRKKPAEGEPSLLSFSAASGSAIPKTGFALTLVGMLTKSPNLPRFNSLMLVCIIMDRRTCLSESICFNLGLCGAG